MWFNLLRNAIRHSGTKDAILELAADDTQIRFAVGDHGKGISFDAYERAGSTAGGGTGLGLALCRKLAQSLSGGLEVESKLGEGARFTVRIDRHLEP